MYILHISCSWYIILFLLAAATTSVCTGMNVYNIQGRIMSNSVKSIGDWKWIGNYFDKNSEIFLQFTLLVVNHVDWVKSIATNESQLELPKVNWNFNFFFKKLGFLHRYTLFSNHNVHKSSCGLSLWKVVLYGAVINAYNGLLRAGYVLNV